MADKTCKVCGRVIPDGHICLSCGDYDDMQTFNQQPKTNGDRIRAMTNAELAKFLGDIADCCSINFCKDCPMYGACVDVPISMQKWLNMEVQNE